jgi:hypothetical protein
MALATIAVVMLVASPVAVYATRPNEATSATQTFNYAIGSATSVSTQVLTIGRHSDTSIVSPVNLGTITPSTAEVLISSSMLEVGKDTKPITLNFVSPSTTWACSSGQCAFIGVNVTVMTSSGQQVACISAGTFMCSIGTTFRPTTYTNYTYYTLMLTNSSVPSGLALQVTVSQS